MRHKGRLGLTIVQTASGQHLVVFQIAPVTSKRVTGNEEQSVTPAG